MAVMVWLEKKGTDEENQLEMVDDCEARHEKQIKINETGPAVCSFHVLRFRPINLRPSITPVIFLIHSPIISTSLWLSILYIFLFFLGNWWGFSSCVCVY